MGRGGDFFKRGKGIDWAGRRYFFGSPPFPLRPPPPTQQYRFSNLSAFPFERCPPHLVLSSLASPARESRKGKKERAGRKRRPGNSSALSSPNWYIAREGTNCEFTHDPCRKIVLCPVFSKNLSTDMWFGFGFDIVVIFAPVAVDLARRRRGEEVMDGPRYRSPGSCRKRSRTLLLFGTALYGHSSPFTLRTVSRTVCTYLLQ